MTQNQLVRSIKSTARRLLGMSRWASSALPRVLSSRNTIGRLLLIYDFASQPFSVGDILIYQEAGLVLCEQHGITRVDFAALYDPAKPVVGDPAFAHIDAESFLYHLSSILPAAQANPRLGSLMLFDSRDNLESYIADNIERYLVWPALADYASGEYLFYRAFRELFMPHFRSHGRLPSLGVRPAAAHWAQRFLAERTGGARAVTVQLRLNPANPARDSVYDAWLEFFRCTAGNNFAKFIVICGPSEVDARFREIDNVIVAKDAYTSLEQDLALIEAAAAHMGASSGPGTIALFSNKPFCMFGLDLLPALVGGLIEHGRHVRFPFSLPTQNWIREKETAATLIHEFQGIWAAIADRPAL